jgi:hypothetical protein
MILNFSYLGFLKFMPNPQLYEMTRVYLISKCWPGRVIYVEKYSINKRYVVP